MKDVFVAAELEGMAGVRAALKTGYDIVIVSQEVYDFSFPFIAPLEAEDNVYLLHFEWLKPGYRYNRA